MLIGGIDEAGRGPVLGPMIVAMVIADEKALDKFKAYGVKDSKKLSPYMREKLYAIIKEESRYVASLTIEPHEIDEAVFNGHRLTVLEAEKMAALINKVDVIDIIYIDAAHIDANYFKNIIQSNLTRNMNIVCEHNADERYVSVSAASIIAKVERDKIIKKLKEMYGDFGSGYPSDQKTINFLKQWINTHDTLPPFARKSWSTIKKLLTNFHKSRTF